MSAGTLSIVSFRIGIYIVGIIIFFMDEMIKNGSWINGNALWYISTFKANPVK